MKMYLIIVATEDGTRVHKCNHVDLEGILRAPLETCSIRSWRLPEPLPNWADPNCWAIGEAALFEVTPVQVRPVVTAWELA